MKYDKIVAINKQKSEQKARIAIRQIEEMLERKERITVTALARYTGFSQSFFNRNPTVRKAMDDAKILQGECYNPKKVILDKAVRVTNINLKIKIKTLEAQIKELSELNLRLEQEIKKLKK